MNLSVKRKLPLVVHTSATSNFIANTLLFDLDGTLADTAPDLTCALNETLRHMNYPIVSLADVKHWIGDGMRMLLQRAISSSGVKVIEPELLSDGMNLFESFYSQSIWINSFFYPGIIDGLGRLKSQGFKLGCVTNKQRPCAEALLAQSGLADYFGVLVAGGDLAVKKPSPEPLLLAAHRLMSSPPRCVMIGDSKTDIDAAQAASMHSLFAIWGYHDAPISIGTDTKFINNLNDIFRVITLGS